MSEAELREALDALGRAYAVFESLGMPEEAGMVRAVLVRCGGEAVNGPVNIFRRDGEYWFIAFEGDAFRLRDAKGLRYLARMLACPSREVHALELMGSVDTGGGGVVLDSDARLAYRARLGALAEDLEEAESWHDGARAERVRWEIDALVDQLSAGEGLGGRARSFGSSAERARQAVTKALRAAVARIEEHSPALGAHLASTVRTGVYCRYTPDPRVPVAWRL